MMQGNAIKNEVSMHGKGFYRDNSPLQYAGMKEALALFPNDLPGRPSAFTLALRLLTSLFPGRSSNFDQVGEDIHGCRIWLSSRLELNLAHADNPVSPSSASRRYDRLQ
jgi:hypothetical protein